MKKFVSMIDLKLVGLQSHDCHVFMKQVLPVVICGILPKNVRVNIIDYAYSSMLFVVKSLNLEIYIISNMRIQLSYVN